MKLHGKGSRVGGRDVTHGGRAVVLTSGLHSTGTLIGGTLNLDLWEVYTILSKYNYGGYKAHMLDMVYCGQHFNWSYFFIPELLTVGTSYLIIINIFFINKINR